MHKALQIVGASNAIITPAVVVSICALLFTVGSFWWIQARRGRLRSFAPNAYGGLYGKDQTLINLPLVIHNMGPAPLAVTNARLRLRSLTNADKPVEYMLHWHAMRDAVYTDSKIGSRCFASPFAVEGRRSVEKYLEFQRNVPDSQIGAVPYEATVEVQVQPQRRRKAHWTQLVTFTLHAELITEHRGSFLQRSNDPDLMEERSESWVQRP